MQCLAGVPGGGGGAMTAEMPNCNGPGRKSPLGGPWAHTPWTQATDLRTDCPDPVAVAHLRENPR
ncbi:hypothetical protein ISF6_3677 [Piscinibacter sakaiensis]|uniref:Uncharacterized protein n=1 Tax=Piscinibacter sakaiensis TaxID=1547922 RepID=A0A0K8P512_PISS1|nr:hypothetical protein ISF6_3677 [Piscinibacter sakaiensis]